MGVISSAKRRAIGLAASGILVVAGLQAVAVPTFAATPPTSGCSWGDVQYTVDSSSKPYLITHATPIYVSPGWTYSQSTSLTRVNSITASVTGTLETTAEGNFIIGKVGAKVGLSLQTSGTSTVSSSVAYTWSYTNTSSVAKRFVLFTAPHKVTATYTKWQCDRWENWFKVTGGTVVSWDTELRGSVQCGATTTSGSPQRLAQAFCPPA